MADLIELDVVVRDKTIKQSISTVSRLERELTKAAKAIEESRISQDRYNKILLSAKREYQALGLSSQKATASVRKFVTEQRYLARTTDVVQNEMRQATSAVNNHTRSLRNSASSANEVRNQYVRMNAATFKAQQGAKRFASVGLQQAGYQVGDFIVQVQNGQSALVAFGQQGSQLAGIFGPAGAIIGAFIAAGTALGMIFKAFNEAGQGAKDLTESLQSLGDAASSLEQALETHEQSLVDLVDKYGVLAVQIRETQVAMAEAAAQKAFLDIRETATLTTGSIDRLTKATQNLRLAQEGAFDQLPNILQTAQDPLQRAEMIVEGLAKELGLSAENAVGLGDALKDIQEADSLQEQSRAAAEVVRILDLIPISVKEQNQELFTAIEQMAQVAEQGAIAARATEKLNGSAPGSSWMDDAIRAVNSLYNRIVAAITGVQTLKSEAGEQFGEGPPLVFDPASGRFVESGQEGRKNLAGNLGLDLGTGTFGRRRGSAGGSSGGGVSEIEQLQQAYETLRASVDETFASQQKFNEAQDTLNKALEAGIISTKEYDKVLELVRKEYGRVEKGAKSLSDIAGEAFAEAYVTTEEYNELLKNELMQGIESVSGAFTDFIMNGLRNFEDFADAIKATFRNLIATLIQTAIQNQIIIPIATSFMGNAAGSALTGAAGSAAGSAGGSLLGGLLGTGGGGLAGLAGSGGITGAIGSVASGVSGIFSGGGLGASFANLGGLVTGSAGGLGAIGAALPAVGIIAAGIGLISKAFEKQTESWEVITGSITNMDANLSRFGMNKSYSMFSSDVNYYTFPIGGEKLEAFVNGVKAVQQGAMDAADTLGVAESVFNNFQFSINPHAENLESEIMRMGDAFAALVPGVSSLNELLEVANERYQLQTRLLQLQGNSEELIRRQREQELAAIHPLNEATLRRIYALEDERRTQEVIQQAINERQQVANENLRDARNGVNAAFDRLRAAINAVVEELSVRLDAANERLNTSRDIFNLLRDTVRDRRFGGTQLSESNFRAARSTAQGFLRSGDITDQAKLEEALQIVSEPSENLFGSFTDYARDFFRTSATISDLEKTAGVQLSADEEAVQKLEEQITQAQSQMDIMRQQYNTLLGIETGVLSIPDAIANLKSAFSNFSTAQSSANAAEDAAKDLEASVDEKLGPVESLYQSMLGRNPDEAGLNFWRATGIAGEDLVNEFRKAAISQGEIPRFSSGGMHTGGLRMVGEQGPEMEVTGPSRIFSREQTADMFRDPELAGEVRSLRSEVAGLRSENSQLLANNNKYTKRSYDLYRKWDVDGQPPVRT